MLDAYRNDGIPADTEYVRTLEGLYRLAGFKSRADFSRQSGVSIGTIRTVENTGVASKGVLQKLAATLQMDPNHLRMRICKEEAQPATPDAVEANHQEGACRPAVISIEEGRICRAPSNALAPEILAGDYLKLDAPELARSGDAVVAEDENGTICLVRLERDGDTLIGVIENSRHPGPRIRVLSRVLGRVCEIARLVNRPSR